jgi:DNA-directed RNA polymerase specialized sigma24 family protein
MEHDILAFGQDLIAARPRLRERALRLAGHPDRAGQLVQQTMKEAWRDRDAFEPGQDLDDWLRTILRRRIGASRSFAGSALR